MFRSGNKNLDPIYAHHFEEPTMPATDGTDGSVWMYTEAKSHLYFFWVVYVHEDHKGVYKLMYNFYGILLTSV